MRVEASRQPLTTGWHMDQITGMPGADHHHTLCGRGGFGRMIMPPGAMEQGMPPPHPPPPEPDPTDVQAQSAEAAVSADRVVSADGMNGPRRRSQGSAGRLRALTPFFKSPEDAAFERVAVRRGPMVSAQGVCAAGRSARRATRAPSRRARRSAASAGPRKSCRAAAGRGDAGGRRPRGRGAQYARAVGHHSTVEGAFPPTAVSVLRRAAGCGRHRAERARRRGRRDRARGGGRGGGGRGRRRAARAVGRARAR